MVLFQTKLKKKKKNYFLTQLFFRKSCVENKKEATTSHKARFHFYTKNLSNMQY